MSKAYDAFLKNDSEVDRLLQIHTEITGTGPGKREGVEVLNKSAIIMICACWETYVEDVANEAAGHLADSISSSDSIAKDVRKSCVASLGIMKSDEAAWSGLCLSWKDAIRKNAESLTKSRLGGLNTPKTANVDSIFCKALGIQKVSQTWKWKKMKSATASSTVDALVELRGDLAHRTKAAGTVKKATCSYYRNHIKRVVNKTEKSISDFLTSTTGKPLSAG
ncbi:MAG: HEPN domain-containing protein [Rhodospirillaceae bacterium]|nr:HEPN domain-containing protein [Rhodospirillaceae bacterium]